MNCSYCKREMHTRQLSFDGLRKTRDHYIPISRGGGNAKENIRPACSRCNSLKGSKMPDEWEQFMRENPMWWARQVNVKCLALGPVAVKASAAALRAMTAAENERRMIAYRALRKDEPLPIEYDDPVKQAVFEAAYSKWGRHLLRVPVDVAAP